MCAVNEQRMEMLAHSNKACCGQHSSAAQLSHTHVSFCVVISPFGRATVIRAVSDTPSKGMMVDSDLVLGFEVTRFFSDSERGFER